MREQPAGRFWAVGVGPGDPRLLTVKAVEILQSVQVLYHPGPGPDSGRAWEIVRALPRPATQRVVALAEPMSSGEDWRAYYLPLVDQIASTCLAGQDAAFICEGDPTLYSTAACIWQLLAERHPRIAIEVVPGVSSVMAAAARVRWPLAQKGEPLAILPASYHAAELHDWISRFPNLCLLKPARALPDIVRALETFGPAREAIYIENLGTNREWVTSDLASILERKQYFSLVLVRAPGGVQQLAEPIDQEKQPDSQAAGAVIVVGLGPGDADLLTPRALTALQQAHAIVGYEGYLKPLAGLDLPGELIGSPIGEEAARARQALELAQAGKQVALVSSGDAGVYGMASLLMEAAGKTPGMDIEVIPGVTAALSAAALLGAPLGHDFACISLSDLLTPWEVIERRLESAARGDFVVALYNPLSRQRTWQLPRARDILLTGRPVTTPVGLVDKAHRIGMHVWHTTLGELTPAGVGMETMIIVGNSQTRVVDGRMVTPRKHATSEGAVARDTAIGNQIMVDSFAIIEQELGPHSMPAWLLAVVRRMIHASGDFDYARSIRFSPGFEQAVQSALRGEVVIVTDTEMVRLGIQAAAGRRPGATLTCTLNDPQTERLAEEARLTRSAAGMRIAASRYARPILAIGNAPTALQEAIRLVEEEGWRPQAIIGMPVGFVGVQEAKEKLQAQSVIPYLSCTGRKGGSAVTAAAMNALLEL